MKKYFILMAAALLCACQSEDESVKNDGAQAIRFEISGDFNSPTFTRSLSADGVEMTDLWIFDFVNEECVQSLHLTPEDDGWDAPEMTLAMGNHNVCFVASRGGDPVLDESAQTITWGSPRDAFWADKDVTISQGSSAVAVELARVATKLKVVVNDKVPANAASIVVKPERWYYGINYWTGEPAGMKTQERSVSIPASYVGTTGQLAASFFGISAKNEWTTNVDISAKDADGNVMATVAITGAPFKANRATEYSGRLFGEDAGMTVSLSEEWESAHVGTW